MAHYRKRFFAGIIILLAAMAGQQQRAHADIYQYTDRHGTVCMTNSLSNVPPAQRKSVKIIREESPPQRPAATSNSPHDENAPSTTISTATDSNRRAPSSPAAKQPFPLKLIGLAAAAIGCLFGITRLTRSLSSPQLAKVIYLAFFLGTFTLGYKLYADHLVNGFVGIKQKMITMFAKAQQREGLPTPQPAPINNGEQ